MIKTNTITLVIIVRKSVIWPKNICLLLSEHLSQFFSSNPASKGFSKQQMNQTIGEKTDNMQKLFPKHSVYAIVLPPWFKDHNI